MFMQHVTAVLKSFRQAHAIQDFLEYSMLLAFVALAVVALFQSTGRL